MTAELHLHAGGSYPTDYLLELASAEDRQELEQFQETVAKGVAYKDVFKIFGIISRIINTTARVEEGTYRICEAQKRDGVTRLEIRSGIKVLNGEREEAYLEALLRGIQRSAMNACVLLSVKRDSSTEYVEKTCQLALQYRQRGVVGIDISGDSTVGDIRPHFATLKKVRDAGLFLTAHIGESREEKDQMLILQELRPHRVGHAAKLVEEAVEFILREKIPVEVCPTSARLCGMHGPDDIHPWVVEHKRSGHPIVIGTDDSTVFGTTLPKEYESLRSLLGIDCLEALKKSSHTYAFRALPEGYLPFCEFSKKFMLAETSTEKRHPITQNLSHVFQKNVPEGMELLLKVDELVLGGFQKFIETIARIAPLLACHMASGGRVFLIGSGSSGRVSVDIASRCQAAFPNVMVMGIVSGGDSAMIRPKEGFEDSFENGVKALQGWRLNTNDMVFVISASGSATFNEGVTDHALKCGAGVYYFYNSEAVPERTQALFDRGVTKLCVDIGPQAVAGSTRLQAATLAQCCLGSLLASALYMAEGNHDAAASYPKTLLGNMKTALDILRDHTESFAQIARIEHQVFSSPESNFRRLKDDPHAAGYVTFLAMADSMREVLIDATESSPTFSTNPIRRETEEGKKRAEFRAYMVGEDNAWKGLLGREVMDQQDVNEFLLSADQEGVHSYKERPKGPGNFVLAVAKVDDAVPEQLLEALDKATGVTGLLLLSRGAFNNEQAAKLRDRYGAVVIIEDVPSDLLGLSESLLLKQALNLISNSSMALMNKMSGNLMIDVRASNEKLRGRCVRLVHEITKGVRSQEEIYHAVAHVQRAMQKSTDYVPAIVKIVAEMYAQKLTPDDFAEVVEALRRNDERLTEWQ
ncbi:MAG: hypothetical protein JSR37_08380 [Verrucomicrobia bacterium]|nr:hypothetical protein [Verrucomicrobiota bacterium]MBS0637156.1 hypothetical protein [Verrucomicrobiota bacterium]